MRAVPIFSLYFSVVICASFVVHQSNESNLKERALLLLTESKDVGPEKLNRWLSKVEVLNGKCIEQSYFSMCFLYNTTYTFKFNIDLYNM